MGCAVAGMKSLVEGLSVVIPQIHKDLVEFERVKCDCMDTRDELLL